MSIQLEKIRHKAPELIHHFLEHSSAAFPDRTAVIHGDSRLSYGELNAQANAIAAFFMAQGVVPGDRIALLSENSPEYVIGYYAALKAGAAAVPLSTELLPRELEALVRETSPKGIIASARFQRLLKAADLKNSKLGFAILASKKLTPAAADIPAWRWDEVVSNSSDRNPELALSPSMLASIIYTSGSTGKPKGVMLSHGNIVANAGAICRYLEITQKDIQMVVIPFYYVMGKSLLNTHIAAGATIVINNNFAFPASVVNQMMAEKVTSFSGVPSTFAFLLHRSPLSECREKLNHLRYCSQAGGHMASSLKRKLAATLPGHTKLIIMYGATEASARLTYLPHERLEKNIHSIGIPIDGVTIRILDKKGCEMPSGQVGELVAQGPNIMLGYWKDESATKAVLDHNGYHTGDLGHKDADGYLYVTGRRDSIAKVNGHRINLQEIEDALMATEHLMETAVFAVPDDLQGNRLLALAAPRGKDVNTRQLYRSCSGILPKYKLPSEIKLVPVLPKKHNGKIDRKKCIEIAVS